MAVPFPVRLPVRRLLRDLFPGVVDEGAKFGFFLFRQTGGEGVVHFLPDDAGAVVQDVKEGVVFPVQVAHEMLHTFGEDEAAFQLNDSGAGSRRGGIFLR